MIMVGGATVGLTLCYDIRFPGLYMKLAELGAQVICVAASWGAGPGKVEQWQLLTRARALDSTSYLVAAAQADLTSRAFSISRPASVLTRLRADSTNSSAFSRESLPARWYVTYMEA